MIQSIDAAGVNRLSNHDEQIFEIPKKWKVHYCRSQQLFVWQNNSILTPDPGDASFVFTSEGQTLVVS
jgi:hypothetical protein